ncbi:uncharacterized protein LOC127256265 [Andrographis paniculata]|uniref:uncharacterized protein LOC127256265 n=1 Tax=Andrographis paniculata TaxID=175694 RepID=UPI0021E86F31|nr:uncharacterized protein LOC127256265 [Andrographis paniculata]
MGNHRFLRLLHPSEAGAPRNSDQPELHEDDFLWSFPLSSSSSSAGSPPPSFNRQRNPFNRSESDLSAAIFNDGDGTVHRNSSVNPKDISQAARREEEKHHLGSAPVNIPLWTKELRVNGDLATDNDDGARRTTEEEMVPPHVMVARSHVTFSVFEGRGRTLKGRDLRRVRNAVFQQTGFID